MAESDRLLVERAKTGDHEAFAALVETHARAVTALALAMVGLREDARDLAQEAFVEAYKRLGELREPGRFKAWVSGIARRKCIYLLRERASSREVDAGVALAFARASRTSAPDAAAETAERGALVRSAVNSLPERDREVVMLRYTAGLPPREIAEYLDLSVDAVEKRLERAKAELRAKLAGM